MFFYYFFCNNILYIIINFEGEEIILWFLNPRGCGAVRGERRGDENVNVGGWMTRCQGESVDDERWNKNEEENIAEEKCGRRRSL